MRSLTAVKIVIQYCVLATVFASVLGKTKIARVSLPKNFQGEELRVLNTSSVIRLAGIDDRDSSKEKVAPRVSYGNDAAPGDFPYIGLTRLTTASGASGQCASTKIAPRVAMTAAHCLADNLRDATAAYGIVNQNQFRANQVSAYEYTFHENYNSISFQNDIGLLAYENEIPAQSVLLSTLREDQIPSPLYVAGWGKTEVEYTNGNEDIAEILQYADVPYIDRQTCDQTYRQWGLLPPSATHICAGGDTPGVPDSDACMGDSGGPLAIEGARWPTAGYNENIQVGITSYGPVPCGGPNDYGGYTSVAQFTTWINDQIWYFNWEGTSIPSVLNTLVEEDVCFSGAVISSNSQESGGNCCAACKGISNCGAWAYDKGTRVCKLHEPAGFVESAGNCQGGWLNRDEFPPGTQRQSGFVEYTDASNIIETGAVSAGACAQFCVDTPGCKYFTWLGPLGGDQYNVAGANCQVADSNATPVPSSRFSGNTYGEVQTGNTPTPSPSPPPPSVTPSPPPPSVTPSPPPPSVTPSPPPFFPLPSPPPPPVEKICDIDEGTYLIYGYDSGCGTRYLNSWTSNCKSRSVKAKKKTSRTATRFVVESKGNNRVSIRAVKSCTTKNKYVAVKSRVSSARNVYLSSYPTSWRMISYDGSSCSKVIIRAVSRENRNYSSNMSRSSRCGSPSVFTSSRVLSSGYQYWRLRKLSSSTSLRKC
ncbi:hypothetical protein M9435_000476 [Picochlorum sp. BPE23]|nr:hypothetical protein M9435_000476 [Picochlorum sp. BPE23]